MKLMLVKGGLKLNPYSLRSRLRRRNHIILGSRLRGRNDIIMAPLRNVTAVTRNDIIGAPLRNVTVTAVASLRNITLTTVAPLRNIIAVTVTTVASLRKRELKVQFQWNKGGAVQALIMGLVHDIGDPQYHLVTPANPKEEPERASLRKIILCEGGHALFLRSAITAQRATATTAA